jgi:hypothetical protein
MADYKITFKASVDHLWRRCPGEGSRRSLRTASVRGLSRVVAMPPGEPSRIQTTDVGVKTILGKTAGFPKSNWEAGIRTPISRSRVCCPTVGRPPKENMVIVAEEREEAQGVTNVSSAGLAIRELRSPRCSVQ